MFSRFTSSLKVLNLYKKFMIRMWINFPFCAFTNTSKHAVLCGQLTWAPRIITTQQHRVLCLKTYPTQTVCLLVIWNCETEYVCRMPGSRCTTGMLRPLRDRACNDATAVLKFWVLQATLGRQRLTGCHEERTYWTHRQDTQALFSGSRLNISLN